MNENHVIRWVLRVTKNLLNKYTIFALLLCSFGFASAQNSVGKVTGTVLAESNGEPLIGVSILVKGSPQGTMTDLNGAFTIKAKIGETLRVSYIGYAAQNVKVGEGKLIIRLKESEKSLDEVVVVGYGTQKRKDLTGSISSISGKELLKTQPATFDQALQGKVAGVVVQQVSGQPGGGVSIQIHGISSISSSNSPLYVIDGVIIPPTNDPGNGSNPLNTINPSEIENIDVLKDASATAIYGSQATNGVIVITTKRGSVAAPQITYEGYTGYQQIAKRLPTVNLQQLASFLNDRSAVWGFDARPEYANPKYLGTGTDWQKELFRNAPMSNHSLAISGGDTRTQYQFSVGYFDQQGIALGSDFKRYSVRLNLDNKTTDWLKVGTSLQLSHVDENVQSGGSTSGVISSALSLTANVPVKNSDGSWGGVSDPAGWVQPVANPIAQALVNKNKNYRYQVFGNIYAEIKFSKKLSLRNEVAGNFDFTSNVGFQPQTTYGKYTTPNPTTSSYSAGQSFDYVLRNYLTYVTNFGENNLTVKAGHEAELRNSTFVSASRSGFPSNSVQSISSGDPTTAKNTNTYGDGSSESYFGQVFFNWLDKYLFTFNLRGDGSDKFPANIRWATTSSGAFAWKINNEKFLKNVNAINELKLRLGYGLTNNQGIPGNTYVTLLTSAANGLSGTAQFQSNLANPLVTWEKTKNTSVGLDGAFFNWRLNFSVDVYDRGTDGLLLKEPFPAYSGTTTGYSPGAMQAPYVNVGAINNKGIDVRVGTTNISNKDFTWKTDVTVSHNVNKVLNLGSGGKDASLVKVNGNSVSSKTVVGRSVGEFYGYVYDGIFATANDFKTHALPADQSGNPRPVANAVGGIWYGDRMYKDLNGDGIIDTKDQTYLGSPLPKFQFGFNNSFKYKDFDFNIFFSGNIGNKVYNQLPINQTNPLANTNYFTGVLNYAKTALIDPAGNKNAVNDVYVTNPNTTIVSLRNNDTNENSRFSSLFLEDASFIRCKNITLGYNVPQKTLAKVHITSLRLYANVSNAFTITKYKGMDPEVGSWDMLQAGYDGGYYPQPRVFTLGMSVKL